MYVSGEDYVPFHSIEDVDFTPALDHLPRYAYISVPRHDGDDPTRAMFSDDGARLCNEVEWDVHNASAWYPLCLFDLDRVAHQEITVSIRYGQGSI